MTVSSLEKVYSNVQNTTENWNLHTIQLKSLTSLKQKNEKPKITNSLQQLETKHNGHRLLTNNVQLERIVADWQTIKQWLHLQHTQTVTKKSPATQQKKNRFHPQTFNDSQFHTKTNSQHKHLQFHHNTRPTKTTLTVQAAVCKSSCKTKNLSHTTWQHMFTYCSVQQKVFKNTTTYVFVKKTFINNNDTLTKQV